MQSMTMVKKTKRIHARSGWSPAEEKLLEKRLMEAAAQGESLRWVFEEVARQTGRKPNSVRNYYYTVLRTRLCAAHNMARRPRPAFETFTPKEARDMLKTMLHWHSQGMSIRACASKLAQGDHTRMLRYQNKYRSLMKNRPPMVQEVIAELQNEGVMAEPLVRVAAAGGQGDALSRTVAREVRSELARILQVNVQEMAMLHAQDVEERAELLRRQTRRLASLTREYLDNGDDQVRLLVEDCIEESMELSDPVRVN